MVQGSPRHTSPCESSRAYTPCITGNLGDVSPVGEGVSELRINYGPGYRVYFVLRGKTVIILLGGGDKSTQADDISNAKVLAKTLRE